MKTVWHFDGNRRVYRKNAAGVSVGGPIYRQHWREVEVKSETSRSYVTIYGKCPKDADGTKGWALTADQVERDVWIRSNRLPVVRAAERWIGNDYDRIRKLAELVGYKEQDDD